MAHGLPVPGPWIVPTNTSQKDSRPQRWRFRAPASPAQRFLGGGFGRGAKPPSELFGGSALLMTMFSAGVLLNISQHSGGA
jgi:hypothetical protein